MCGYTNASYGPCSQMYHCYWIEEADNNETTGKGKWTTLKILGLICLIIISVQLVITIWYCVKINRRANDGNAATFGKIITFYFDFCLQFSMN
jgi:K+ transporter